MSTLRRLRKAVGLTQVELAERAEVPQREISAFERGKRDLSRTAVLVVQRLATALACAVEALLEAPGDAGGRDTPSYAAWRQAIFEREQARNPDDPTPRYALGVAAFDRGDYVNAIELLEGVVVQQPQNTAVYQVLARAATALYRHDEARTWLRQVIEQARLACHHYHRQEMQQLLADLESVESGR